MAISKSTDSSSIRYFLNVRAQRLSSVHVLAFYQFLRIITGLFTTYFGRGSPRYTFWTVAPAFVSHFAFWRELFLIPNSTLSETVHQQTEARAPRCFGCPVSASAHAALSIRGPLRGATAPAECTALPRPHKLLVIFASMDCS